MVIGTGLIANLFAEYNDLDNYVLFASGVSNSLEKNVKAFDREKSLLKHTITINPHKILIYFSTCSIYDVSVIENPYVQHKLEMESIIKKSSKQYYIFRLTNLAGSGGNKNTLLNYFVGKIRKKEKFDVWENATRNILDVNDCLNIVNDTISELPHSRVLNIANPVNYNVLSIVEIVENHFQIKGDYSVSNNGIPFQIDTTEINHIINKYIPEGKRGLRYLNDILSKYY